MLLPLYYRFYNDFLRNSRISDFRAFLQSVIDHGYTIVSASTAASMRLASNRISDKMLVLRTDVDTDPRTARSLWQITRQFNVNCSFYFRLSTIDFSLMKEMAASGDEVGYHYEELSTLGKWIGVRNGSELRQLVPKAQMAFAKNISKLRDTSGLSLTTAAAHGDWLNRRLGVSNAEILKDRGFRDKLTITFEAYDPLPFGTFLRCIDQGAPMFWLPSDPLTACRAGASPIYVTVHPRQWHTRVLVNLLENLSRANEEIQYRLRALRTISS